MQDLINLLNDLSEKYDFEESDIKKLQQIVFSLENGDHAFEDMEQDDFVNPDQTELFEAKDDFKEEDD